jgi:hypothetical protein
VPKWKMEHEIMKLRNGTLTATKTEKESFELGN